MVGIDIILHQLVVVHRTLFPLPPVVVYPVPELRRKPEENIFRTALRPRKGHNSKACLSCTSGDSCPSYDRGCSPSKNSPALEIVSSLIPVSIVLDAFFIWSHNAAAYFRYEVIQALNAYIYSGSFPGRWRKSISPSNFTYSYVHSMFQR